MQNTSRWISALIRIASSHPAIEQVLDTIARLSEHPVRTSFLLLGEPGTGKEGLARALAELCGGKRPLGKARIAGLSAPDQRKALTGEKGALAGTRHAFVVIDELCALEPAVQLEVLDHLRRPNGPRLIAMTDEDPLAAVARGTLRHDLYYRVARIVLALPPLRERLEDIPAAAVWMGNRLLREHGVAAEMRLPDDTIVSSSDVLLSNGAIMALKGHNWPGNFRELEAVLERALLLYRGPGEALTGEAVAHALATPAFEMRAV